MVGILNLWIAMCMKNKIKCPMNINDFTIHEIAKHPNTRGHYSYAHTTLNFLNFNCFRMWKLKWPPLTAISSGSISAKSPRCSDSIVGRLCFRPRRAGCVLKYLAASNFRAVDLNTVIVIWFNVTEFKLV